MGPVVPLEAALVLPVADEAETARLARGLAKLCRKGDVVGLVGDLGAGKTTFARHFINALMPQEVEVPSPTFTLLQVYEAHPCPIFHFDLYRLARPEEAFELGIEDAFADGISLIEWPEKLGRLLPADILTVDIVAVTGGGPTARRILLEGVDTWRDRIDTARDSLRS